MGCSRPHSQRPRMMYLACTRMLLLFQEYRGTIVNDNPLTAKVLDSYIDIVEIMLGLQQEREIGCSISHQSASWSYDVSLMTRWIMHVPCHNSMPQCHTFPLTTQWSTNSSCKVVSASSLVARFPSAASLWIKPSRKHSTEIHRQQEAPRALAWYGLLWSYISSLLSTWGSGMSHLSHPDLARLYGWSWRSVHC